jgi:hypothetical protein
MHYMLIFSEVLEEAPTEADPTSITIRLKPDTTYKAVVAPAFKRS